MVCAAGFTWNSYVYYFIEMQVLWLSDGAHTVHVTQVAGIEYPARESDENGNKEKEMLISGLCNTVMII